MVFDISESIWGEFSLGTWISVIPSGCLLMGGATTGSSIWKPSFNSISDGGGNSLNIFWQVFLVLMFSTAVSGSLIQGADFFIGVEASYSLFSKSKFPERLLFSSVLLVMLFQHYLISVL